MLTGANREIGVPGLRRELAEIPDDAAPRPS